jgi:hypothetical protein
MHGLRGCFDDAMLPEVRIGVRDERIESLPPPRRYSRSPFL